MFAVSRFMGSSIALINHHYGHLANDSRQYAVSVLDALAYDALRNRRRGLPPVADSVSLSRFSR